MFIEISLIKIVQTFNKFTVGTHGMEVDMDFSKDLLGKSNKHSKDTKTMLSHLVLV